MGGKLAVKRKIIICYVIFCKLILPFPLKKYHVIGMLKKKYFWNIKTVNIHEYIHLQTFKSRCTLFFSPAINCEIQIKGNQKKIKNKKIGIDHLRRSLNISPATSHNTASYHYWRLPLFFHETTKAKYFSCVIPTKIIILLTLGQGSITKTAYQVGFRGLILLCALVATSTFAHQQSNTLPS